MHLFRFLIVILVALVVSMGAAQDLELGAKIVQQGNTSGAAPCMACHGMDGAGMPGADFPRLAGKDADYLVKQIHDYRNETRISPVMLPIANALTDEEIVAASEYFAAQEAAYPSVEISDDDLELGRVLADEGNWDSYVPSCSSCHGPNGIGVGDAFPALIGQHAAYTVKQFDQWRADARHNDPFGMMHAVAVRLTDEEIAAVAAWYAHLGAASMEGE